MFWFAARIFVGGVIAYAGLTKLLEPSVNFEISLMRYGVFPPLWIPWIARILPWVEWILGSFFVVGYLPRLISLGIGLLSLSFLVTLGSSQMFVSSGSADCGCFGTVGFHLSVHQVFVLDLFNFVVAIRSLFLKNFPWSLESFLIEAGNAKNR